VIAAESQSAKLGLWLFIAADSMFFLGLVGAFMVLRSGQPETFAVGAIDKALAFMEAALLLIGSASMMIAVIAAGRRGRLVLIGSLALTVLVAAGFLIVTSKFLEIPTLPMDASYACYFTLWAAHSLHVIAAMIAILILLAQAMRGKILPAQTHLIAIYWHFLVLLWILLFPILFFAGTS
jgi:cytochrome c oxidase subunit 3